MQARMVYALSRVFSHDKNYITCIFVCLLLRQKMGIEMIYPHQTGWERENSRDTSEVKPLRAGSSLIYSHLQLQRINIASHGLS